MKIIFEKEGKEKEFRDPEWVIHSDGFLLQSSPFSYRSVKWYPFCSPCISAFLVISGQRVMSQMSLRACVCEKFHCISKGLPCCMSEKIDTLDTEYRDFSIPLSFYCCLRLIVFTHNSRDYSYIRVSCF